MMRERGLKPKMEGGEDLSSEKEEILAGPEAKEAQEEVLEPDLESKGEDERREEHLEQIRGTIEEKLAPEAPRPFFEQYQQQRDTLPVRKEQKFFRRLFGGINEAWVRRAYRKFPEVKESNDPASENFYLRKVDQFNQQQEQKAEELGFKKRIAFLGHNHSRGVENWQDGSDGSLTPEQIFAEYQKAIETLKAQGVDQVFITITDHNSIENSIRLAQLLQESGVAQPIVGIEAAVKEGYEVLGYTTDLEKLRSLYYGSLEPKLGKIFRYAKSGLKGKDLIEQLAADDFVMGISHPSAAKAILFGGTMKERFAQDPELAELMAKNAAFYEGLNWFQNVRGSNCVAFGMREQMAQMGIECFANEDFHSKVSGSEGTFFNGMYTEIRTDAKIQSGEDLLNLLRQQKQDPRSPKYTALARGLPATEGQYKEHLNNATGRVIRNVLKAVFGLKK